MTIKYPWELNSDGTITRLVDHEDGSYGVEYWMDTTAIQNQNRRRANEHQKRFGQTRGEVGFVPNVMIMKWLSEAGADVLRMKGEELEAFVRRKLNDGDFRDFKTIDGNV